MSELSVSGVLDSIFGSKKPTAFDQAKDKAVSNAKDKPVVKAVTGQVEKPKGVKIHVTQEYIKQHGTEIVGTKGDDVFVVDADVKKVKIQRSGGKDRIIFKKSKPEINFPKLPDKK